MNNLTRREILKLVAASAAAEIVLPGRIAASIARPTELTYRLFFDEQDLERMRGLFTEDARFADYREKLLALDLDEEQKWMASGIRYNDQLYDLPRLGRTSEHAAFRYAMTGEPKAAEVAANAVREMLRFPAWDYYMEDGQTIGVQRASSSIVGLTLAADCLGDRISAEERAEWITVMGKEGCEPCYLGLYGIRNPREVVGWHFDSLSTFYDHRPDHRTDLNRRPEITANTNLRAVPASALVIGAIAHQLENGKTPENERWLEMGLFNVAVFGDIFEEDGSYNEGVGYANYTALHVAQATAILGRHSDIDLGELINWTGYTRYQLNMWMPTSEDPYEIVNFSDNGNPKTGQRGSIERTAVPTWVASQKDDGVAQWIASNMTGQRDHWSLMWFDPSVEEVAPEPGPRMWVSDLDWVVARSGFEAKDLVVAMRSGAPANHEHADRNSIVVKCFGEQLVTDPYRPPYLFADPAWRMRLTEGHSAVLIDGKGHEHHNGVEGTNESKSFARIIETSEGDGYFFWNSDATQPYRLVDLDVKRVLREVVVLYELNAVVIVDRVQKFDTASTIEARFFGYNYDGQVNIMPRTDGFITSRPGAVMRAHVMSNVGVSTSVAKLDIPEERAERHPYAAVTTEAGKDILLATVLAISPQDAPTAPVSIVGGGGRGSIQVGDRVIEIDATSVVVS